jgi:hypothetical protein
MSEEKAFFVDVHYYAVKYKGVYSNTMITSPPPISEYDPYLRVPMQDVGYGQSSNAGVEAIEHGDLSYFEAIHIEDAAMPGLLFLSARLSPGDAVISPDGTMFILIRDEDCQAECDLRKTCAEQRMPIDGRLFPMLSIGNGLAVLEMIGIDHDLCQWVARHYGKTKDS